MSAETAELDSGTKRRVIAAVAGLVAAYLFCSFYHLRDIPLVDPDEPRYAAAGRTMAEGGSWLFPQFNGQPRINKPPLFYWTIALSDRVFGQASEVSARLPSIVAGLAMLLLTLWFGARMYGHRVALLAGLILCTSPLFLAVSRTCVIDQLFATLLTASLSCLLLGLANAWPWKRVQPIWITGIGMGLAFMAKGTAAILVFLVPLIFALAFLRGDARTSLRRYIGDSPWKWSLGLGLLLSCWWYVWLIHHIGWTTFNDMASFEIQGRLLGAVHRASPFYYLYVGMLLFFPWSLGLPGALWSARHRVRQPLACALAPDREGAALPNPTLSDAFLCAWLVTVLLFFSVPLAKLGTYILPAFPAAALLTARLLLNLAKNAVEPASAGARKLTLAMIAVFVTALLAVAAIVGFSLVALPSKFDELVVKSPLPVPLVALVLAAYIGGSWLLALKRGRIFLASGFMAALIWGVVAIALPAGIGEFQERSSKAVADQLVSKVGPETRVVAVNTAIESLVYYLHRPVTELRLHGRSQGEYCLAVLRELSGPESAVLLLPEEQFARLMGDRPPEGARILLRASGLVALAGQARQTGNGADTAQVGTSRRWTWGVEARTQY